MADFKLFGTKMLIKINTGLNYEGYIHSLDWEKFNICLYSVRLVWISENSPYEPPTFVYLSEPHSLMVFAGDSILDIKFLEMPLAATMLFDSENDGLVGLVDTASLTAADSSFNSMLSELSQPSSTAASQADVNPSPLGGELAKIDEAACSYDKSESLAAELPNPNTIRDYFQSRPHTNKMSGRYPMFTANNEYDFEQANAFYESLNEKLQNLRLDDAPEQSVGTELTPGPAPAAANKLIGKQFYNPAKSFFDNISTKVNQKYPTRLPVWRSRQINTQTFGARSVQAVEYAAACQKQQKYAQKPQKYLLEAPHPTYASIVSGKTHSEAESDFQIATRNAQPPPLQATTETRRQLPRSATSKPNNNANEVSNVRGRPRGKLTETVSSASAKRQNFVQSGSFSALLRSSQTDTSNTRECHVNALADGGGDGAYGFDEQNAFYCRSKPGLVAAKVAALPSVDNSNACRAGAQKKQQQVQINRENYNLNMTVKMKIAKQQLKNVPASKNPNKNK